MRNIIELSVSFAAAENKKKTRFMGQFEVRGSAVVAPPLGCITSHSYHEVRWLTPRLVVVNERLQQLAQAQNAENAGE